MFRVGISLLIDTGCYIRVILEYAEFVGKAERMVSANPLNRISGRADGNGSVLIMVRQRALLDMLVFVAFPAPL